MADRQLSFDRRADRDCKAASAARLQPRASASGQRAVRRAATRLRHCIGNDLARRWAGRRAPPEPIRRCLSDGDRTESRRALGDSDHAAAGADREPAPRRCADGGGARRSRSGERLGRPDDGDGRERSQEPDSGDRRHGAVIAASRKRLRGGADASSTGPEPGVGAGADVDRAATGRIASDDRPPGAAGSPAASFAPGVDQQQYRQLALIERDRLARVRRTDERRRKDIARRPCRRSRVDGIRNAR